MDERMNLIRAQFDNLHFAYYQNMDIGDDGVWDVCKIEGPTMVGHFRGNPHVHTWVNIREITPVDVVTNDVSFMNNSG